MSTVVDGTTQVTAQPAVDEKANEMSAIYTLLDSLDLTGTLIATDAMHTHATSPGMSSGRTASTAVDSASLKSGS